MLVFIVYENDYEDSHNHGVFSTIEKAQDYITLITTNVGRAYECNYEIQEMCLDVGEFKL